MSEDAEGANRKIGFFMSIFYKIIFVILHKLIN